MCHSSLISKLTCAHGHPRAKLAIHNKNIYNHGMASSACLPCAVGFWTLHLIPREPPAVTRSCPAWLGHPCSGLLLPWVLSSVFVLPGCNSSYFQLFPSSELSGELEEEFFNLSIIQAGFQAAVAVFVGLWCFRAGWDQ